MNKKLLKWGMLGAGFVLIFMLIMILLHSIVPSILHVHQIRKFPESFKDTFGVIGKVVLKDDSSASFMLIDVQKKHKAIPVLFSGQIPVAENEVIAYGQFRAIDKDANPDLLWWEYVLEVERVKIRNTLLSGDLLYKIRLKVHEVRRWIYQFRK